MAETVTFGDMEFDRNDLRTALDRLREQFDDGCDLRYQNIVDEAAACGDVGIVGDEYDDRDVFLFDRNAFKGVGVEEVSEIRTRFAINDIINEIEAEAFKDYLSNEVFTMGTYAIYNGDIISSENADAYLAEHDGGEGFIVESDMARARDDENVTIIGVKDGWLRLTDDR